jgi:predicted molibdopterin-dependent oxidoreductase YjgC
MQDFPYMLQYCQAVHHQGYLTEKSENLMRIAGQQIILMNPDDAARENISEGEIIKIGAEAVTIEATANITEKVNRGELLLLNSFSANPVNRLMNKDKPATCVLVRKS